MKVLFLGRSVAHFSYYDSVLAAFATAGHDVHFQYDEGWSRKFSDHALRAFREQHPDVTVGTATRRTGWWRRPLFFCRELRTYASYEARRGQSRYYRDRWAAYLPRSWRALLRIPPARWLVGSSPVRALLAAVERAAPPDDGIVAALKRAAPEALIVSPANMRFSEQVDYLKAARTLGIPSALVVLSWDNLSTKGLLHERPDLLLAWNASHRRDAIEIHGQPEDRIAVVGAPFFDKWFDRPELSITPETFATRVGLDPNRPFAVYLGSSRNIARDESWVVEGILAELSASDEPLQLLIRPHPANAAVYARFENHAGVAVWPKKGSLPDSEEAQLDLEATLAYAVGAVGINTSGMIDAVIADLPTVAVVLPQYDRTQSEAVHFQSLRDYDAITLAPGIDAAAKAVRDIRAGDDPRREARRNFVREFVRPHGWERSAGAVAAETVVRFVEGARAPSSEPNVPSPESGVTDSLAKSAEKGTP